MSRRESLQKSGDKGEPDPPVSKPLYVLHGQIKTPPMGSKARQEAGYYLRMVQDGESLAMPTSRPMPQIAPNCHELRIPDEDMACDWRVIYFIDDIAILVLEVFQKKTQITPEKVKDTCRDRRARYLVTKEGR